MFWVLGRSDGTDLRTGSRLLVGEVAAHRGAELRLANEPLHLLVVGGLDDPSATHRPWRVFEVEGLDVSYDDALSMNLGFGQQVASRLRVLAERTLDEALGFSMEETARQVLERTAQLQRTSWFMDPAQGARPRHVRPMVEICTLARASELAAIIRDARSPHWADENQDIFERLFSERSKLVTDVANVARANASCSRAVEVIADVADACERATPEALSLLPLSPAQLVQAHLSFQLVEPMLSAPPNPLVNPFAPLAELIFDGYVPLGWYQGALAIYCERRP